MPNHPIYHSPQWKELRREALKRDHYRCIVCQCDVSGKGHARVDHIVRISDGGAPFDIDNVRTLCVLHDNQSHREKAGRGADRVERFVVKGCDANGWPIDTTHHWNAT